MANTWPTTTGNIKNTERKPQRNHREEIISQHLEQYLHGQDTGHRTLGRILNIRNQYTTQPEPQELNTEEYTTASQLMLKLPMATIQHGNANTPGRQCNTCRKSFSTMNGRILHRHKSNKCVLQATRKKTTAILPPNQNCSKILPPHGKPEKHRAFYCHTGNTWIHLNSPNNVITCATLLIFGCFLCQQYTG